MMEPDCCGLSNAQLGLEPDVPVEPEVPVGVTRKSGVKTPDCCGLLNAQLGLQPDVPVDRK